MNRTQAQFALLKWSSLTCAVLLAFNIVSILNARPSNAASVVPDMVNDVVRRVPAALLKDNRRPELPRPGFQVWKPPCLTSTSLFKAMRTNSRWIRITSATCEGSQKITDSKLENLSNGYVATVFLPGPTQFTSDFVPLENGENKMNLRLTLASGKTYTYHWTIRRRVTESN